MMIKFISFLFSTQISCFHCFSNLKRGIRSVSLHSQNKQFLSHDRDLNFKNIIQSSENQKIKLVKKLQKERSARDLENKLVLEGLRLVSDAIHAGNIPNLVLCSDEFIETKQGDYFVDFLRKNAVTNIFFAKNTILKGCCDTQNPQGVVAVLQKPSLIFPRNPNVLMVCDNIQDPGNLGTLIRTAACVGVDGVVLLGNCCDLWSPKTLRATMGAVFRVPIQMHRKWGELKQILCDLRLKLYAADGGESVRYFDVDWTVPCALIVGSEANGLGQDIREDLSKGDITGISIPLMNGVESLNVGVAGAMILGEISRQNIQDGGPRCMDPCS